MLPLYVFPYQAPLGFLAVRRGLGDGVPTAATFGVPTAATLGVPTATTFGVPTAATFGIPTAATFGVPIAATFAVPTAATFAVPTAATFAVQDLLRFGVETLGCAGEVIATIATSGDSVTPSRFPTSCIVGEVCANNNDFR